MHTLHLMVEAREFVVHHNGDWSGDITISTIGLSGLEHEVAIPYSVMEAIVTEKIRDELVNKLQFIEGPELLKLLTALR